MDEVGRGTSTLDGLSLASAIFHHLHSVNQCRGIFATHYHELARLIANTKNPAEQLNNVGCYQTVVSQDSKGNVYCLYQVRRGIMDQSHGIEVAKSAGLPRSVIESAAAFYKHLKSQNLIH